MRLREGTRPCLLCWMILVHDISKAVWLEVEMGECGFEWVEFCQHTIINCLGMSISFRDNPSSRIQRRTGHFLSNSFPGIRGGSQIYWFPFASSIPQSEASPSELCLCTAWLQHESFNLIGYSRSLMSFKSHVGDDVTSELHVWESQALKEGDLTVKWGVF